MKPVEYRIEYVHIDNDTDSANLQLVSQLNQWAREGWRVANLDLNAHPQFGPKSRTVLLEREIDAVAGETESSTRDRVGSSAR